MAPEPWVRDRTTPKVPRLRLPGFWLRALVVALVSLTHWSVVSFLLPIFVGQGHGEGMAVLAGAVAPMLGALLLAGPGLWALMADSLTLTLVAAAALRGVQRRAA